MRTNPGSSECCTGTHLGFKSPTVFTIQFLLHEGQMTSSHTAQTKVVVQAEVGVGWRTEPPHCLCSPDVPNSIGHGS